MESVKLCYFGCGYPEDDREAARARLLEGRRCHPVLENSLDQDDHKDHHDQQNDQSH